MADLQKVLPGFATAPFASLLPAIEHHALTTTDLLALHPADLAKQTRLPLLDLRRFVAAVRAALVADLAPSRDFLLAEAADDGARVSTLDEGLDAALGGGFLTGHVSEVAGESGAGKTQLLLALCLAVQLPPPRGLGRQAIHIATEASLATGRLAQMMANHPLFGSELGARVSLDNIHSIFTPDLEVQEHILEYQVPVLLSRHAIGLLVIDSVAANYRAEFDRYGGSSRGSNMAARSVELIRLGALLRDLARRHNIAVVVANQVADRFLPPAAHASPQASNTTAKGDSPLPSRSLPSTARSGNTPASSAAASPTSFAFPDEDGPPAPPALRLDHQQRWFTGWGDDPHARDPLKTPSLGLVWTTQVACRVALIKRPVYGLPRRLAAPLEADDEVDEATPTLRTWRRWLKVVFAPHVAASGLGLEGAVEVEVTNRGLRAVEKNNGQPPSEGEVDAGPTHKRNRT